jgi:flagellar M-ring protein FliF
VGIAERLKQLLDLLPVSIRILPPAKLFALLGLLGAILAVGLVSVLWMSGDGRHQLLYTQLTMEDAAAITAKLREMQVPYTIEGDGTTIMVPATMVYDTRLRLATEGLPQGGGTGFELFDQRSFGMTEFVQKLNYRRALQGELARTITQLAAVQSARVHIVLPEKSLFVEHQDKPTSSVVVKLVHGRRLSQAQIRGVAHLIGSSVEGLNPDDVTVLDINGDILSKNEGNTSFLSQTETQLSHQQTLEQQLERRVQSLLEHVVGKGKVLVRVSASLDFQHIERTEERFDADNPAIRSEQRSKEKGAGPGFFAIGLPGVRSNVDVTNEPQEQKNTQITTIRENETINYELTKTVSKIVAPSGEVKKISVAVLVDGSYKTGDTEGAQTYVPRAAEELVKYEEIVKSAVGYNEARGDQVVVANTPFEPQGDLETLEMAKESQRAFWLNLGRYGAYVVLGLLFLMFIARPLVRWIIGEIPFVPTDTELPRTVRELEADMEVAGMLGEGQEEEKEILKISKPSGKELRTQMAEFIRTEPERAVEIFRVWLRG